MGGSKAFLDGKPLIGAVNWGLQSGVRPHTAIVTMKTEDANALTGAGGTGGSGKARPVTLRLEGGLAEHARSQEFKDLYVLHEMPAPAPAYSALMIADRRWLWPNALYRRFLNVRRKIGTKRLKSQDQIEAWDLLDELSFAPYSLYEGKTPWTPKQLMDDLAEAIIDWETEQGGATPKIEFPNSDFDVGTTGVAIQDLEMVGQLDACIEQALAYLPGLDVTVDADGTVRFFWRNFSDEVREVNAAGPELMGRGHITPVSFGRVRPSKIRVYFDVHCDLRFDTEELASASSTYSEDPDGFWAKNVLPIPDFSLTIGASDYTEGTWVTFPDAINAWGPVGFGFGKLDFPVIRRAMVPFMSFMNMLGEAGKDHPDQDWANRLAAVETHYRRTFQINRRIMDRLASIHPYRVSTINVETGTRGSATVYSDFSYLFTGRSRYAEGNNDRNQSYVINCAYYPSDGVIGAVDAAPAILTIEDSDQGIYSIEYRPTKTRALQESLPAQVEIEGTNTQPGSLVVDGATGPSPFLGVSSRGLGFGVLGQFQKPPILTANHKTIVVMSAVPAAPNSKRSLCWVDVAPTDVPLFAGRENCEGPMLEIHIGAGLEVARVAWQDSRRAEIWALINRQQNEKVGASDQYTLKDLVVNYDSDSKTVASLTSIARAAAARVWHSLRDHSVGSATYGFAGEAKMQGSLTSVDHELDMAGALTTRLSIPSRLEAFDINRYLNASTQRIIRRIIDPRG